MLPEPGAGFIPKFLSDGAGGEVFSLVVAGDENLWKAAAKGCAACPRLFGRVMGVHS